MISKMAQLHYSGIGTQRFLYKNHTDTVTIVRLDSRGQFVGSESRNKVAARVMWDSLVNHGWTAKGTQTKC